MEKERQEIKELPEKIKAEMLSRALALRDEWHEEPNEWITPADYATARDDRETKRLKTGQLNQKRLNKYTNGWFNVIFGEVIQPLRGLPPEEEFRLATEEKIEVLWQKIQDDFARTEKGAEQMLEDFVKGGEFQAFCNDPHMCADICEIGKGDIYLYGLLRQGAIDLIFEYIWKFEAVQKKFDFKEQDFRSCLADKITPLVEKLQVMKRQYTARSPEAVQAGNEILIIVIKELQK